MMDGCPICGRATARSRRLCASCGAHLGEYETLDSGRADLAIPVRRYGGTPPPPARDQPPRAAPAPRGSPRRVLALACAGATLAGALALAALLAAGR